jgi:hypothetical protein
MLRSVKDNKGFTFVELLTVIICLTVLVQMAWNFFGEMRRRSYDVSAVSDGRNLMTVVRANFVHEDDVDYTHNPGDGANIGTKDTSGNPRAAVFILTPGVNAKILGESGTALGGSFDAILWHEGGTDDPASDSGKREFWYFAEEATETYSLPTY